MVEGKPISDSRKGCPYKVYVNKFMQNSGAEIICSYTIVLICNIATAVYCRIYACKSQFNIPNSTAENKKQQPLRFLKRLP